MTGEELISTQSFNAPINRSKFPVLPESIGFLLQCILITQDFEYAIFLNEFVKGPIVYYVLGERGLRGGGEYFKTSSVWGEGGYFFILHEK